MCCGLKAPNNTRSEIGLPKTQTCFTRSELELRRPRNGLPRDAFCPVFRAGLESDDKKGCSGGSE
eukprot:1338163-Alexandrium_andersonii.AAC.1